MKALLVPDSFKGTLSSREVSAILQERILAHFPTAEVIPIPVADGGEGSVDCFLTALGGERVTLPVEGPFFEETEAFAWLMEHCADYGFILRFPEGKEDVTGVIYEPWHYRYVGTEAAKYIMENDLCLEEYLELMKK